MGLGALLGFGRTDRMMRTVEEAIEATAIAIPGFPAIDAVIGADGRAVLTMADDGRIALVCVRGKHVSGREVTWPMLRQTIDGIIVETADRRFGEVTLLSVTALDIRRLGQVQVEPPSVQRAAPDTPELASA
ncbi:hypothetical protein [Sphingomonas sp.]|jgi:hypothetical protein|uniref:hypothetical protein n=1 Tax=Sphingomonas sp. TaxID=28214 RepID=UPI0035C7CB3A